MDNNHRTLEFLSKNYHPFTHFSKDMLAKADSGLRIFNIKAGESLSLQACSPEDMLYITDGTANITFANDDSHTITFKANDKEAIHFSSI